MFDWVSAILLLCILAIISQYLGQRDKGMPPGPPSLPIIGSLPFLGDLDIRKAFAKMTRRYGRIFLIRMGMPTAVVLSGYDVIADAFSKNGKSFSDRPRSYISDQLIGPMGISGSQGKPWKEQRRYFMQDLKLSIPTIEEIIRQELSCLSYEYTRVIGQPINHRTLLQKSLTNILTMFNFSLRYEYSDAIFNKYEHWMNIISRSNLLFSLPFLRHLPGDMFCFHRNVQMKRHWLGVYRRLMEQHRQRVANGEVLDDFVSRYMKQIDQGIGDDESTFSEVQLVHLMDELIVAGVETTTSTLSWAVLFLALHPAVQKKIHTEIKTMIGPDVQPTMCHLATMPYTHAAISEIQRLGDVSPFSLPHATTHDVTFRGYHLPKGVMVIGSISSINMDPDIWPSPHKFDPERFLGADGSYKKPDQFIPYSIGPRMCPGSQLARMELFLYVSSILQRFEIQLPKDKPEPNTRGQLGLTNAPRPFDIVMETR